MPAKRSILVVDDDEVYPRDASGAIGRRPWICGSHRRNPCCRSMAINDEASHFEAVILDLGMPDGNGCDYRAQFRREGHNMPVIMLTGSHGEEDVVRGLSSGANDYIAKPFRFSELLARLRAQLREFDSSEDATFPIGPFIFHPSRKLLQDTAAQRCITLTAKEAGLLKVLCRSNAPVERPKLLHEVWGYNEAVSTHTLETHIYRLRQKVEPDPAHPTILITERNGYRLDTETRFTGGV